ncbi:putative adenylate dimethylallyltransferase (ADP/ATP-dependent) [Helianthus anomalus]
MGDDDDGLPCASLLDYNIHMVPSTLTTKATISTTTTTTITRCRKRKIIIIMGPTGAESRLSIDLATYFFHNAEIVNSDKMQVYKGLNITTNKITIEEQLNVPPSSRNN